MKTIKIILFVLVNALMNLISKFVLGVIIPLKLNVRYKNIRVVYSTRGPFVFLPNHTNQWDPFLLCFAMLRPIRWVASDGVLRDLVKNLILWGGVIPKVKEQSDMITIEGLRKAIAMGYPVGIFPEGEQNWVGSTQKMIPATAKLVRFLKIPVIVPIFKGGYLTKPRWSWQIRRTRIDVHFTKVIDADEIKTMKLAEIEQRIAEALVHDDYEWQKENMVPIRSNKRAEHLELAHYICPSCETLGTLKSEGNSLFCSCGYRVEVDSFGFFQYPEAGPAFDSPGDWVEWQNALLAERIREQLDSSADPVLLRDGDVTLMRGERAKKMLPVLTGEARLYKDRLEVGNIGGEIISFPLNETTAANTFKQQKFEFRYEKVQYRLQQPNRSVSGYKWEVAYKGLRNLLVERGEW
ncbi:MAG: hypothetical protein DRP60_12975 [Spirochaetes bacterium]|nr:MAG: hypothetical protein DRP60_12975 [Spirochaetota bacterium]